MCKREKRTKKGRKEWWCVARGKARKVVIQEEERGLPRGDAQLEGRGL